MAQFIDPSPVGGSSSSSLIGQAQTELQSFYHYNPQIKQSHGLGHALAVHAHAVRAIEACTDPRLSKGDAQNIELAALLHDVDDHKYFPRAAATSEETLTESHENATRILRNIGRTEPTSILKMISWVGCSENGNTVPDEVESNSTYYMLIPRWSDRLEAVGPIGVVRCYRYNQEKGAPLSGIDSPRGTTNEEVYDLATPDRFDMYLKSGGKSRDMISHYYDKLLHIARPPPGIVRNAYLEGAAEEGSKELVEVCVRYGRAGAVDEEYILDLEQSLSGPKDDAADATAASTSPLDSLPPHVLTSILAKYCDTYTLSSSLTALMMCSHRRRTNIQALASAMKLRVDTLEETGRIPATRGNARWNRQSMAIADQLRMLCHGEDGAPSHGTIQWEASMHQVKRLILLFPIISFFEDEPSRRRQNLRLDSYANCDGAKTGRFELPLWAGYLPITFPTPMRPGGADYEKTEVYKVLVTSPDSTWQPILLAEWSKLNEAYGHESFTGSQPKFRPRPRRATPLPPLARIRTITGPALSELSLFLTESDHVIEIDVPKGNRILIMSRLQACARLRSSSIWQYYVKERRSIVEEETWSLAFRHRHTTKLLTRVIEDPFFGSTDARARDIAEARDIADDDNELFAFMEPTDSSNDEAGGAEVIQMAQNVKEFLHQYEIPTGPT